MILQHFNKLERPPFHLMPFMKVTTPFLYAEYGSFLHHCDAVGFLSLSGKCLPQLLQEWEGGMLLGHWTWGLNKPRVALHCFYKDQKKWEYPTSEIQFNMTPAALK